MTLINIFHIVLFLLGEGKETIFKEEKKETPKSIKISFQTRF